MDFVVMSSSRGTTFQAVIDAMHGGSLTARCVGLITDHEDRGCREKALAAGLPVRVVERHDSESRDAYAARIDASLQELGATSQTIIAALGWMWIMPPSFTSTHTIVNVHPALLPKYGGKGMYGSHVHEAVLAAGDRTSGITIHLIDDGVDTGKILLQKTCPVLPDDTPETLQARVQELEKEWYPKVLEMIERGEMELPL